MWIRLTHKFADILDGVDLRSRHVGEKFELPNADAHLLIAEEWAVALSPSDEFRSRDPIATANASTGRSKRGGR